MITQVIGELNRNKNVFRALLQGIPREMQGWKPLPEKWSLLEIVCHLFDEEREDFRARLSHVIDMPEEPLPKIDPVAWVTGREYARQNFEKKLTAFIEERIKSVEWLASLKNPPLDNAYIHEKFGPMSGYLFLNNWLAHDYLHIRQIIRTKYEYLKVLSPVELGYAGEW